MNPNRPTKTQRTRQTKAAKKFLAKQPKQRASDPQAWKTFTFKVSQ